MTDDVSAAEEELSCFAGLWWINFVITSLHWTRAGNSSSSLEDHHLHCLQVEEELTGHTMLPNVFKWTDFRESILEYSISDDDGHKHTLSWWLRTLSIAWVDLSFILSALDRIFMFQSFNDHNAWSE